MNLDPAAIRLRRGEEGLEVRIAGVTHRVDRVVRAFPKTNPQHYVGLLDPDGREIGLIEDPGSLEPESRVIAEEALKAAYFVPTILEIRSVSMKGAGSTWQVLTDDGEREFRIQDREALDGSQAPAITVSDEDGKRYAIESYWTMDRDSRDAIRDLLPDKVLRTRGSTGKSGTKGMVMRFR